MKPLAIGDQVIVKIYHRWRHGQVVKVFPTRVEVQYATPHGRTPTRRHVFRVADIRIPTTEQP